MIHIPYHEQVMFFSIIPHLLLILVYPLIGPIGHILIRTNSQTALH